MMPLNPDTPNDTPELETTRPVVKALYLGATSIETGQNPTVWLRAGEVYYLNLNLKVPGKQAE